MPKNFALSPCIYRRYGHACRTSTMGFNIARLYAERGHHAGLDVTVNELNHDCSKLMQAAIPFCEEWRSFSYTGFHSTLDSWHLREHRIPMKLPRLEHLQVGNDSDGVYKSYYMPNLTSALFINTILPPPSCRQSLNSQSHLIYLTKILARTWRS